MKKIILDTDIGTDVDDALALSYLLANPECDLLGITTGTGEPVKRAMLASVLCKMAGRNIPIYPGTPDPIIVEQLQKVAQQAKALPDWPHDTEFPQGQAIEYLRRTIRENPGEITLVTIGPLSNIGLLFTIDPEIPGLLKELVSMSGYFFGQIPEAQEREWNAMGDPHASRAVYDAKVPRHRSIGLDVTMQVVQSIPEFHKAFSGERTKALVDFAGEWFKEWNCVTFHDPLAAALVFHEEFCTYEKGNVHLDVEDPEKWGKTTFTADPNGRHEVAKTVNKEAFLEHYFDILKGF